MSDQYAEKEMFDKFLVTVTEIAKTQLFEAHFYYEVPGGSSEYRARPNVSIKSIRMGVSEVFVEGEKPEGEKKYTVVMAGS